MLSGVAIVPAATKKLGPAHWLPIPGMVWQIANGCTPTSSSHGERSCERIRARRTGNLKGLERAALEPRAQHAGGALYAGDREPDLPGGHRRAVGLRVERTRQRDAKGAENKDSVGTLHDGIRITADVR